MFLHRAAERQAKLMRMTSPLYNMGIFNIVLNRKSCYIEEVLTTQYRKHTFLHSYIYRLVSDSILLQQLWALGGIYLGQWLVNCRVDDTYTD